MQQKVRLRAGCPARIKSELLAHENQEHQLSNMYIYFIFVQRTVTFVWHSSSELPKAPAVNTTYALLFYSSVIIIITKFMQKRLISCYS